MQQTVLSQSCASDPRKVEQVIGGLASEARGAILDGQDMIVNVTPL